MSKFSLRLRALLLGIAGVSSAAGAQAVDTAAKTRTTIAEPGDSLFLRARQLVLEGNGSVGRALVDSAVRATEGTPEYATALYWRGALASTAADAERDYRRVIVDYPFSTHSGDALLALAQLEMARGERESAIDHLQRFLLQRPNAPERIRAGIWLGRMLLDENQSARGCAVLLRTRASLGDSAVEVRNQVDYYTARCAGIDTTPRATAPDTARRGQGQKVLHSDSIHRRSNGDSAAKPLPRESKAKPASDVTNSTKRFTVQVAAYDTRAAAEQLATRLAARGIVARVVNAGRAPYRVRVGRYATDEEATTAARELKKKGIEGFVTTTDNEPAAAPPKQ